MNPTRPQSDFFWFTNEEMSNDFYHDKEAWTFDFVSGSSLCDIHQSSPASWFFAKNEITKALEFGTQSHTNFESKALFDATYRRAPAPEDYKDLITSQAALAAKLKSFGLTGTSGKQYPDLIKMMVDCGEDLNVLWLIDMIAQCKAWADGVELVKAEDYDKCKMMRAVLESVPEYAMMMESPTAMHELSLFGKISGVNVKVKLDYVDTVTDPHLIRQLGYDPELHPEIIVIMDYKTTSSANPADFDRKAFDLGYYLKMALQRDLFVKVYDEKRPVCLVLLTQEKKEPFLPVARPMTREQVLLGRKQYMSVIHTFSICKETNVWPGYANGAPFVQLETPDYIKRQHKDIFSDEQ